MSIWTKEKLDGMITAGVEECLSLDYKRAEALAKTDAKKFEVVKDVSSFANSAGGVLIYGIAEPADRSKRHLPERLDPISRADISKEWLEQIIQTIQPRIEGVLIHPVTIDEQLCLVCYVVEIPKSHTAHQARDHVYYKRHNFNTVPMEDHEVRDVMNRRKCPKIRASLFINRNANPIEEEGLILVKLENVGPVLAERVMVEIEIPIALEEGYVSPEKPDTLIEDGKDGAFYRVRLFQDQRQVPIFPGAEFTLTKKIRTGVNLRRRDGHIFVPSKVIKVSVFADDMPPLRDVLLPASVLAGWTAIQTPPEC